MTSANAFALKRSGLLYALLGGGAAAAGVIWAVTEHHNAGFCLAVFYYLVAAVVITIATFSQSRSRKEYLKLTLDERNEAFSTHMWLLGVGVALALTGALFQILL